MSTKEELQSMAQVAISAKQAGDPRYDALVMAISNRIKTSPQQVEQYIMMTLMGVPTP